MTTFSLHILEQFRGLIRNIFHHEQPIARTERAAAPALQPKQPAKPAASINLEQIKMPTVVFSFDKENGLLNVAMAQPGSTQFGFKVPLDGFNDMVLRSAVKIVAGSFDASEQLVERFQARIAGHLLFASGNHLLEDALLRALLPQTYDNGFVIEAEFEFLAPVQEATEDIVFDDLFIQHYEGSSAICWKLADQDAVDYIEFQYSMDGRAFRTIKEVNPGMLNTELPHNMGYYRMVAQLSDGREVCSEVLNAGGEQGIMGIIAVPQPMQNELLVGFSLQVPGMVKLELVFQDGKVMARKQEYKEAGPCKVMFNAVEDLPMGNYQLQVRHGAHLYMKSVFKCCVC
jgi:hypothetical protein